MLVFVLVEVLVFTLLLLLVFVLVVSTVDVEVDVLLLLLVFVELTVLVEVLVLFVFTVVVSCAFAAPKIITKRPANTVFLPKYFIWIFTSLLEFRICPHNKKVFFSIAYLFSQLLVAKKQQLEC
jgi:hypothetical protein